MAVFTAESVFSKRDLAKYYTCRSAYPLIMRFFKFEVEVGCVIKDVEAIKTSELNENAKTTETTKKAKEINKIKKIDVSHDKLNYFYTEVKGYDFSVKLFSSLTLDDFFGKMVLLHAVKQYIKKHHCKVSEAIINLLADHGAFCAIEQDIQDMIALKYAEDAVDLDDDFWGGDRMVH